MKTKEQIYIVAMTCFILAGCIDEPTLPSGKVRGKIYGMYGMSAYRTLISLEEFPRVISDRNGNFEIEYYKSSFDLILGYDNYDYVKYFNLKSEYVNLYMPDQSGQYITASLNIRFPQINSINKRIYCKFISAESFNQFNYLIPIEYGIQEFITDIYLPIDKNEISGKLIYLETSTDGNYTVSYDKFGIKDITLNIYNTQEIVFNEQEISYNPEERGLEYNISLPAGTYSDFTYFSINFPEYNNNSDIKLYDSDYWHTNGNFIVPLIEKIPNRIKLENFYENDFNNSFVKGLKWEFVNPGENVNIIHDQQPVQISPQDNQDLVSETTTFEISDNGTAGVYFYYFFVENYYHYLVVTDKKLLKFSEINSGNMTFKPGKIYRWSIQKYPNYNSIDEFTSVKYTEDIRYNSVPISKTFTFITAP